MNEITFTMGPMTRINFYDMMLFVIDKIIVISSWEQAKGGDEVQDYFYGLFSCVIELVIEIIRGSDASNFRNFFSTEKEEETLSLIKEEQNQNKLNDIQFDNINSFEGRKINREKLGTGTDLRK